ncbi:MAG TPA: alpha/beta fold hydrolase, partial [Thermoanaerobaculia bacterium]|nr:alpha/beta fold hydrolase [Thermoanaerobaculia bacterium]
MSDLAIDAPRAARAVAVLVHGYQASAEWSFFPWLAEQLCDEGIVAVRVTLSDDRYSTQVRDLAQIAAEVQQQFRGLPIFLAGHSRGAAVALLTAREVENLEGVVTWSAIARADRWGEIDVRGTAVLADFEANRERLDVLDSVARLEAPLLAIHGGRDASVPVSDSEEIVARARDGSLAIVAGASHTFNAIHPLVHV